MMFMNKYLNLGYITIIAVILGIAVSTSFVKSAQAAEKEMIQVEIKGMGCEMCADAIKTLVLKCASVKGCNVDLKNGTATIVIEAGKDKKNVLREIDEKLFYPYTLMPAPRSK